MRSFLNFVVLSFVLMAFGSTGWSGPKAKGKVPQKTVVKKTKKKASPSKKVVATKAEKIVERMLLAQGGREQLAKVHAVHATGTTKLETPIGERVGVIVTYAIKPNYQRAEISIAGQKIIQVFYPGGGWLQQGTMILRMPKTMLSLAKSQSVRSDIELNYRSKGIKVALKGTKVLRKVKCYLIEFTDKKGRKTLYHIDKKTMLPIQRSYAGPSLQGVGNATFTTFHSDFRWISLPNSKKKVRLPFIMENYMNGRKIGSVQIRDMHINPPYVKPSLFRTPTPVD